MRTAISAAPPKVARGSIREVGRTSRSAAGLLAGSGGTRTFRADQEVPYPPGRDLHPYSCAPGAHHEQVGNPPYIKTGEVQWHKLI